MTTSTQPTKVVLLYKRGAQPDETLMRFLESQLTELGYNIFIDRHLTLGMDWAREIEERIRTADAVIPLLSNESIHSEMFGFEIEGAHEAAQMQNGSPRLCPVRINYTGPLPEPLSSILDPIQYYLWEGEQDNLGLITELADTLKKVGQKEFRTVETETKAQVVSKFDKKSGSVSLSGSRPEALESIGGAVPLHSEYYVPRPIDTELRTSLTNRDSIILIKGARQMGKTSLLARGMQFSREQGARVVLTDFQKLSAQDLQSVMHFYMALGESLVDQLDLETTLDAVWDDRRGPNANFERYIRREILAKRETPLVWGLDEVDRLFVTPFGSEFFGLVRSWHNERALDPSGPWSMLTMAIAYATEAHLFITDMNQSPFNVGTRLSVEDFSQLQAAELNRRYQNPLKTQEEQNRFYRLVGGHPYLVRRGLHEMATRKVAYDSFEEKASRDEGIYGDHLRRLLVLLVKDPVLTNVMRDILNSQPCPTSESFYRLRSAGLIVGNTPEEARPRCRLYAMYLRRHLG